jgi:hypothetical protein
MDKHVIHLATTPEEARTLPSDLQARVDEMGNQLVEDGQEEVFSRAEVELGVREQAPGMQSDPPPPGPPPECG